MHDGLVQLAGKTPACWLSPSKAASQSLWVTAPVRCRTGPSALQVPSLVNRYYDPATGQFLTVDPLVSATAQAYSYAGDDPVNNTDPLGLWGLNLISDVTQAASDVGHYVAKHKAAIAEIAVGVVVVVGATVLTLGVGDALLAAGAAAAEEAAAAAETGDALGSLEAVDLAIHAPFALAPGLLLGGIGLATTGYGIYSLFGGSSGSSGSSCG